MVQGQVWNTYRRLWWGRRGRGAPAKAFMEGLRRKRYRGERERPPGNDELARTACSRKRLPKRATTRFPAQSTEKIRRQGRLKRADCLQAISAADWP
jgi:hypothetical protein